MKPTLLSLLRRAKDNNKTALTDLLQTLHPLLVALSRKLNNEDTYQDLVLHFIHILPNIPDTLVNDRVAYSYIKISLTNHLYTLQRKEYTYTDIHIPTDPLNLDNFPNMETFSIENKLLTYHILDRLSSKDREFLQQILRYDFSFKKLSTHYKVTLQAIYKRYYAILKKLK